MLLARFWNNRRGGIAPLLALAFVPLMGAVGAAVDYSRASAARTAFQAALDSTALMLSKTAANQTTTDFQASATAIFHSLYTRPDTKNIVVTATYTSTGGSKVTLNGTAAVATHFVSVLGYQDIDIAASATSTWGNSRLRVALVLDNTGSMWSADKMTALKAASISLLTQLKNAAVSPEDVYVSIIPFNKVVNVGPGNVNETWLRWDLWDAAAGKCSSSKYKSESSCTSNGKVWTTASHSTWDGCVTDRDQNFDTTNATPTTASTAYPADQYPACPTAMMQLSNDWTALNDKITAMQPAGSTNQGIGLQIGWQSLTAAPFTVPAMDSAFKYQQVIILLTDGLNTQNRWYNYQSAIDARQEKTCNNIKASGITLYTVQVNTGGDPTSTLLQNCASDSSKFFLLTSSTQIVTTFNKIGTALSNLRIAM